MYRVKQKGRYRYKCPTCGVFIKARGVHCRGCQCDRLKQNYPEVWNELEYFSPSGMHSGVSHWPGEYNWIAIFWVTGDSEGYYVHVEAINNDNRKLLLLGKIWTKEAARKLVNALTEIIPV